LRVCWYGGPLWREVGSVVFSFCRALSAQPLSGPSPTGLKSIIYCLYFWDSSNLKGQIPVFISPRNRLAQLYPRGQSQSHVTTEGQSVSQSVSQYILVSSSLWNLWLDIIFCLKIAVLSLWSALSDERSGLSPVSHCQQCLVHYQRLILFTMYMSHFYVYAIYTRPQSAQAQYSMSWQHLRYNSSPGNWTTISLTADKFKPLMFCSRTKSKSKSCYDRRPVSQYVLVSSSRVNLTLTWLSTVLLITYWHWPHKKHCYSVSFTSVCIPTW
jgi:hypothetical protein